MQVSLGFFMEHYLRDEPKIISKRLLAHYEPYGKKISQGGFTITMCSYDNSGWSPKMKKLTEDEHKTHMRAIELGKKASRMIMRPNSFK